MDCFYYSLMFILGLAAGMLINACICRIPFGKPLFKLPLSCAECGAALGLTERIPVLGYIVLKGKYRCCGKGISLRYSIVELLTAVVFLILLKRFSVSAELLAAVFLMSILIAVFFIDIDHRIIPDSLVVAGIAGGLVLAAYNAFTGAPVFGEGFWGGRLLGLLPGTGVFFLVALIGMLIYKTEDAMGMGDVKLFAPIGIFLGWRLCIVAVMLTVILSGITGIVLIVLRLKERKDTIPFGPFIVIGTFIAMLYGMDIFNWYICRIAGI
ncbi:type 4 prepilin peptidase 1 [Anaerobacterium chartisolvens]|uniref:Prepilin leader peptidase/N-methyltransferase n=1 Tax=Anaerobacterium chartisolvens TaxID=1297424 RepID=A0A369ALT7_9FIRM|nr:A24 family peptidase [Anaerobacterium chartisolvens]RCX09298.1 type 4 prepilin peptidase 1 [Anaerobacterium chartisolvens]